MNDVRVTPKVSETQEKKVSTEQNLESFLLGTWENLADILKDKIIFSREFKNKDDIWDMRRIDFEDILNKKAKTFGGVLQELAQNTYDHSLEKEDLPNIEYPNMKVIDRGDDFLRISTSNCFKATQNWLNKLKESFADVNKLDAEELKQKYQDQLLKKKDLEVKWVYSWGWLWLLDIARKVRWKTNPEKNIVEYDWKIFEYKINEIQDIEGSDEKIYQLILITKFPIPNKAD